jgi:hypothetical protein
MSTYVIAPTGADIMHFGKGHDDNPPGRGSGRYAWGTGNGDGAKERRGIVQSTVDKRVSNIKEKDISTRRKIRKVENTYSLAKVGTTAINTVLDLPAFTAVGYGLLASSTPITAAGFAGLIAIGVKNIRDVSELNANMQYDLSDLAYRYR